ncbi:MAG: HD-GYP domain-containing protein [Bryobacteraceae bacterium]
MPRRPEILDHSVAGQTATVVVVGLHLNCDGTCRVIHALRAPEAWEILQRERVDGVILPMTEEALELCRRLRACRATRRLPVLMLSAEAGAEQEAQAVEAGADELLSAPCPPDMLRARVRSMLRYKATLDQLEESENVLFTLAQAVEQRDPYTGGHCERLAVYSVALGIALGLTKPELVALHRGGYLHDIGKVAIPDAILFKPGPLDPEEWRVMRSHTLRGEEICGRMKSLVDVLPIIRSHHERWDGSGYPDGIAGQEIPLLARVLQFADIFDALTTARSYKAALPIGEALAVMRRQTEARWHDPGLMMLFASLPLDGLRRTVEDEVSDWQDADQMRRSLESLRLAVEPKADSPVHVWS